MKKVSIIAVAVIFVLSIVAVGFLGMAMHIYNPVSYVTGIEWINTNQVLNRIAEDIPGLGSYSKADDNNSNPGYQLKHRSKSDNPNASSDHTVLARGVDLAGDKKLNLNIKCASIPQSATTNTLSYYIEQDPDNAYHYSEGDNNSCNLVIEEPCQFNLLVSSTDGMNVTFTIRMIFK